MKLTFNYYFSAFLFSLILAIYWSFAYSDVHSAISGRRVLIPPVLFTFIFLISSYMPKEKSMYKKNILAILIAAGSLVIIGFFINSKAFLGGLFPILHLSAYTFGLPLLPLILSAIYHVASCANLFPDNNETT